MRDPGILNNKAFDEDKPFQIALMTHVSTSMSIPSYRQPFLSF